MGTVSIGKMSGHDDSPKRSQIFIANKFKFILLVYFLPALFGLTAAVMLAVANRIFGVVVQLEPDALHFSMLLIRFTAGAANFYFALRFVRAKNWIRCIIAAPLFFWSIDHATLIQYELLSNWGYGCCRMKTATWVGITESILNPAFPYYSRTYRDREMYALC